MAMLHFEQYTTFKNVQVQCLCTAMTDDNLYRPALQPKTKTLLKHAKSFIKKMEEDEITQTNRDNSIYRNDNLTFSNDMIIRQALADKWGIPDDHDKETIGLK